MLGKIFTAVVLLFVAPTKADIKSMKIRSDKRHRIVFENFEFTHTGYVSVAVSSATVTSRLSQPDPSRIGFYIFPKEALIPVNRDGNPNFCPLDSKFITLLFTFQDISPPPQASFHKRHQVTYPGEYILRFANCNPYSVVTMDVRTELYSTDVGRKNYLSAGITQLPNLYLIFAFIYLCFLGVWVFLCFKKRHQPYFHKIHLLMSGLLVVSVLNLFFAAVDMGHVKVRGTSNGWNVVFYIFHFFRSVLLYFVIVLIGAGWSFLKSLRLVDKMILMILFILQCLGNVAFIMIRETGPFDNNWETWITVYFVVEIMCFLATCVPTFCTIDWLRKVSEVDAKAAKSLPHGLLFGQYVFLIFFYLYSKFYFWHVKMTGVEEYWWVYNTGTNSAPEIINLVFHMLIFYMLRPVEKNRYLVRDVEHEVEVPESVPDKNKQFVVVCISRRKYEEAAKIGLWDEEDVL